MLTTFLDIVFNFSLAIIFYLLLILTTLLTAVFTFLASIILYLLLILIALLTPIFSFFQLFLFISNYLIESIYNSKDLLHLLIGSRLFRLFYLYSAN